MPDHRIFQRLHRQLCEKRSFHVTRCDAGQRRAVPSPSLEESILYVVADRPEAWQAVWHQVVLSDESRFNLGTMMLAFVLDTMPVSAAFQSALPNDIVA
ncbi:hypothetical protein TNCV_371421 [Trichonephila clavipes]|nr:hypothetical protein TNCV_371421 [Trichonephila clavipes]